MSDTQGRTEAEPVREPTKVEGDEDGAAITVGGQRGMIVTTDIDVELMTVEFHGQGLVGRSGPLSDTRIRELVNGMSIDLDGKKFVLVLPQEKNPERFFFESELTDPETLETTAHIDGRTLMVLARWGKAVLNIPHHGTRALMATRVEEAELEAAIANVTLAMEGTSVEVRGGG